MIGCTCSSSLLLMHIQIFLRLLLFGKKLNFPLRKNMGGGHGNAYNCVSQLIRKHPAVFKYKHMHYVTMKLEMTQPVFI